MVGTRVGFVGLGAMGMPIVRRLLSAGHEVAVLSRSHRPVEEAVLAGAQAAESPQELSSTADIVLLALPDEASVEAILMGENGIAFGQPVAPLVVDLSTISPERARMHAKKFESLGVGYLDAPMSGGDIGARDGTLVLMIGGKPSVIEQARPVLEAFSRSIVHIGPNGAGQTAKLCNQLVVASNIQAVAEALALAIRLDVDPGLVREAILGGFGASRVLDVHGLRMLNSDYRPGARVAIHAKDAAFINRAASEVGLSLPGFAPVAAALNSLVERGDGDLDHAALMTLLV